ncbi:MAG: exonuclease SbcCD subunit D [Chloroflexota bacterium]
MTLKILHFADAHIDMVTTGRFDPASGLPVRVTDFLNALDQIVARAIAEKVDLVIFAGDAYKDRNPQPTYQREWGKRIMELSAAGIPTVLLVGNHDVARGSGRAHTLQEFKTLEVPHIFVGDRLSLLGPDDLGIQAQVITVPWISRSALMTLQESAGKSVMEIYAELEEIISGAVARLIAQADPEIPLILTAHASVAGAKFGSEKMVMLGHDLVLSQSIVRDKKLDYVGLGHIHKHQELNNGSHPPVVYSGSIERIDFGESREEKGFVLADIEKGKTDWNFIPLKTRRFIDLRLDTPLSSDSFMQDILEQLPNHKNVSNAVCRVQLSFPRDWEPLLDESQILQHFEKAHSIQIVKHTEKAKRSRLGDTLEVEEMTPLELLDTYWSTMGMEADEAKILQKMAADIFTTLDEE